MNNFLRRLQNFDTVDALVKVALDQLELIEAQRQDMAAQELGHIRQIRDLVIQFREQVEVPPEELIPRLDAAIVDLNDSVARLEEHVG